MAGLRVPELMDSVFQAVDGGLKDGHPYVREAAVMGVLKCYHQARACSPCFLWGHLSLLPPCFCKQRP
jgi:vesicle coat complex subunit